jgi:hypothetical protein
MNCPYSKNVICQYVEDGCSDILYECADCPHYTAVTPKPEEELTSIPAEKQRLFDIVIPIGSVIDIIILGGLFLIGLSKIINWIQP